MGGAAAPAPPVPPRAWLRAPGGSRWSRARICACPPSGRCRCPIRPTVARSLPPPWPWSAGIWPGPGPCSTADPTPPSRGRRRWWICSAATSTAPADTLARLADAHPDDGCAASTAALAVWAAGDRARATALLLRARTSDPDDPRIAFLAWFLSVPADPDQATVLAQGRQALPDHPGLALATGVGALQDGRIDAAIDALQQARGAGLPEADGPLLQAYFLSDRRGPYLALASRLGLPLGDGGAIATARDPEASLAEVLGTEVDADLTAVLHTTLGPIPCRLRPDLAPVTVANFVGLSRGTQPWHDPRSDSVVTSPLYPGTPFHRVIEGALIQGGDPLGLGIGGPGYQFLDEVVPADRGGPRFDRPGVLAMANSGPHTNGSQFFITGSAAPHLDGHHTIFGQCDEAGVDVVRHIAGVEVDGDDRPLDPVLLERVEIVVR